VRRYPQFGNNALSIDDTGSHIPLMHMPTVYAILWVVGLCLVGGFLSPIGDWYKRLAKPGWQPPGWAFGPAWTIILGLAGWSAVIAWEAASARGDTTTQRDILILFGVNGFFHLLWSPLFFKFRRPDWALVEVVFLWASLAALIVGLAPIDAFAAGLILPYLAWVSFAAYLNLTIVRLNPRREALAAE
jgi:tryptophan-rich sensory protein